MELSKYYEPAGIESKWYAHWTANHYFNSFPDQTPSFYGCHTTTQRYRCSAYGSYPE